ncbi:bifunctional DNA-binding transcriptional regulator/O6-methylguanine-DNA methyltransferase Ada [Minwuia thermotolerans]|uniref:methylated-DNA--[protein]-cysteine S-methyltransferase n=1 Tax=Minwuia thermotolerans TaxID=2056226 RepID=A0A2M9G277_9PROT|nr:bifunctional DNA-binding transcriptional regulator/O6-methylguanine-DNA methyltransferase Ada [Minwuia thermotolerans]PJK29805.1 bifunctional DNA-binding transcriptional regulator/O6-methylguanine-DNA methyltransferase Ada [Minwuia thermotolerans]
MIEERTMTEQNFWTAVETRDATFDGHFVLGVKTTGIYCRPSCPARTPKRENVMFFDVPAAAEQAGFRPCKRCHPQRQHLADPMMAAIEDAARGIERSLTEAGAVPSLSALAERAGFNAHHFQKAFKRAVGLSPRQYAEARRVALLKSGLRAENGVADAIYGAGYGSPSRVYENADRTLGMAPGVYARGAPGVRMAYGFAASRLGLVLAAATEKGVSAVYLGDDPARLAGELREEYPNAELAEDGAALSESLAALTAYLDSDGPHPALPLDVRATAFQWRVWQALMDIPYGETRTYAEIAEAIGKPKAVRAVGSACGRNPVSLAIPCHRAVGSDGKLHGYRWGLERKQALLEMERRD